MTVKWKIPKHEANLFLHVKGLLYKHIMDSHKTFLTFVIPKAWKYTMLVEAHDKLGHQGATWTYCLIKCQYYWKGMNKDIRKYITQCALCHREKARVQAYPLQMTEIPECPFNKIATDLVPEATAGHKTLPQLKHFFLSMEETPTSFTPNSGANAMIPRRSRIWITQLGSTPSSPSHC